MPLTREQIMSEGFKNTLDYDAVRRFVIDLVAPQFNTNVGVYFNVINRLYKFIPNDSVLLKLCLRYKLNQLWGELRRRGMLSHRLVDRLLEEKKVVRSKPCVRFNCQLSACTTQLEPFPGFCSQHSWLGELFTQYRHSNDPNEKKWRLLTRLIHFLFYESNLSAKWDHFTCSLETLDAFSDNLNMAMDFNGAINGLQYHDPGFYRRLEPLLDGCRQFHPEIFVSSQPQPLMMLPEDTLANPIFRGNLLCPERTRKAYKKFNHRLSPRMPYFIFTANRVEVFMKKCSNVRLETFWDARHVPKYPYGSLGIHMQPLLTNN